MAKETDFQHPPRGHVAMLYYDVANDRFQVVQGDDVDTAIPATAKALLASTLAHTYDGAAWHKQPPIWGYTDRLAVAVDHTKVGSATYNMEMFEVPAGDVYVVNSLMTFNSATAVQTRHRLYDGTAYYEVRLEASQPAATWLITASVSYVLKQGDKVIMTWIDAVDGDGLYGRVWGYKMSIDM